MSARSWHLSVHIDRSAAEVYAFAADPANLPRWAAGLAETELTRIDGVWVAASPMGLVEVTFTARNDLGVLDHVVRLPDGSTVFNPLRVIPEGEGCEVVFTLRRRPDLSEAQFRADAAMVEADLDRLRACVQAL